MNESITDAQLRLLFDLDADLNRIQDLDQLLEKVLEGARATVNADAGSIYLAEDDELFFRYTQNDTLRKALAPGEELPYSRFKVAIDATTISGYCALSGKLLNIPDAYHLSAQLPYSFSPRYDRAAGYESRSMLAVPLQTNTGSVIGVLQLINAKNPDGSIRVFDADDEVLVSHFGSSATLALQRAQLTRTMILRMTRMAELRDPKETGPHVNRVAGFATEIFRRWSRRRNRDPKETDRLADIFRMAAMLHDVGKVGIDDAILKKPGRLDPDEYETMKTHTVVGASLFQDSQSEFDEMAAQVTATHHERWDGKGYPVGLSGEAIPIWGRITSVADVYDALSCHRVYKDAWPEDKVLEEIRSQRGKQFDPEVTDVFFESLPVLRQIFERYPDS